VKSACPVIIAFDFHSIISRSLICNEGTNSQAEFPLAMISVGSFINDNDLMKEIITAIY
jgi:hypothetical protein